MWLGTRETRPAISACCLGTSASYRYICKIRNEPVLVITAAEIVFCTMRPNRIENLSLPSISTIVGHRKNALTLQPACHNQNENIKHSIISKFFTSCCFLWDFEMESNTIIAPLTFVFSYPV